MKRKIIIGILSFISFGIGANIYTDLRGYDHGMFQWVDMVLPISLVGLPASLSQSNFILYHLPDGLWMYSLCLFIILVWQLEFSKEMMVWLWIALFCGLLFEILQIGGFISGTFDTIDLLTTVIAFFFALITLLTIKRIV